MPDKTPQFRTDETAGRARPAPRVFHQMLKPRAEAGRDDLWNSVVPSAPHIHIGAQTEVHAESEQPVCYYVVVSGELIVVRRQLNAPPAVQVATEGDLIVLKQDRQQVVSCYAVRDSVLARTDRASLDRIAHSDCIRTAGNLWHPDATAG